MSGKRSIPGLCPGGRWSVRTKYENKVRLVELSTTVPTRQANNLKVYHNLKVYRVKQYAKSERW